jgi:hypothetical protein
MYFQKNLSPLVKSLRLSGDLSGNHPGADRISILPIAVVPVLSWASNGLNQKRIDQLNPQPFSAFGQRQLRVRLRPFATGNNRPISADADRQL